MKQMAVNLEKAARLVAGRFRLACARARLGRASLPRGVQIGAGVRLSVTDAGRLSLASPCDIDRGATLIVKYGQIRIGPRSYIGVGSVICARDAISIGSDCLIAEHVTIRDQDHRFGPGVITRHAGFTTAPINIGDNVWVGAKTTITKGVTIGNNTVIGANSVVSKDIPANTVAAGSPARVIRKIDGAS